MSRRPSDILTRMRQVTAAARESALSRSEVGGPGSRARVRFTLDLSAEQHKFLRRFALEAETDASQVLRVLLRLLEEDPGLADRVRAELRK